MAPIRFQVKLQHRVFQVYQIKISMNDFPKFHFRFIDLIQFKQITRFIFGHFHSPNAIKALKNLQFLKFVQSNHFIVQKLLQFFLLE